MPDIIAGVTLLQFVTIWGMGWGACYVLMYLPLKQRVENLETKQAELFKEFQAIALKDR
ncbi:MAG: hypothetical protein ACRCYS_08725 [Beijerinckiaceae bacterium]